MENKFELCKNFQQVIDLHKSIFREDNKMFFDNLQTKDYYKTFVASQNDKVIAYCIMSVIEGEAELINIGVENKFRHRGIAKELLIYAMKNINANKYFLEVSTQNEYAIKLYKSLDFIEIYRRKKYYGKYDAIIMERKRI